LKTLTSDSSHERSLENFQHESLRKWLLRCLFTFCC
jgi:hypothetical protein